MQHILVYSDSLSWGIVPTTRKRLHFEQRWPGVMEISLCSTGQKVRVVEDCLNGRRTVWDDPFKPGRNGLVGLAQRIEIHSPLDAIAQLRKLTGMDEAEKSNVQVGLTLEALVGASYAWQASLRSRCAGASTWQASGSEGCHGEAVHRPRATANGAYGRAKTGW